MAAGLSTSARAEEATESRALASLVKRAFDLDVAADAVDEALPLALVELVRRTAPTPAAAEARVADLRQTAARFDKMWAAYEAREIDLAIREARGLKPDTGRALGELSQLINHGTDGTDGGRGFYDSLERYGLAGIRLVELSKRARVGQWVHVPLPMTDFQENRFHLSFHDRYQKGTNCERTDAIESINWRMGEIHYKWVCHNYVPVKIDIDVAGTLVEPPPDWAGRAQRVVVVGRVARAGKRVELADAFVADLRSIGKPSTLFGGTVTEDE